MTRTLSPEAEREVLSVFKIIQEYFCPKCPTIQSLIESRDYRKLFLHKDWVSHVSSYIHGHISHGASSRNSDILFNNFPDEVGFIYRRIIDNPNKPLSF